MKQLVVMISGTSLTAHTQQRDLILTVAERRYLQHALEVTVAQGLVSLELQPGESVEVVFCDPTLDQWWQKRDFGRPFERFLKWFDQQHPVFQVLLPPDHPWFCGPWQLPTGDALMPVTGQLIGPDSHAGYHESGTSVTLDGSYGSFVESYLRGLARAFVSGALSVTLPEGMRDSLRPHPLYQWVVHENHVQLHNFSSCLLTA